MNPLQEALANSYNNPQLSEARPFHFKVDPDVICGNTDQDEPNQDEAGKFPLVEYAGPKKPYDPGCPDKNP